MGQFIGLIIAIIIGKFLVDIYKEKKYGTNKTHPKKGQVIDLSGAWIDLNDMPYQKRPYLLSAQEIASYFLLSNLLGQSKYMVFPKISLGDLLDITPTAPNRQEYLFRIKERSTDLIICELPDFKPVLLLMNEGQSAGRKKQVSDRFTRNAAEVAGLPSLLINPSKLPTSDELAKKLRDLGLEI